MRSMATRVKQSFSLILALVLWHMAVQTAWAARSGRMAI